MRALLVVAALTAVVLAGCTDEPPSGEISGTSVAVPFDGTLAIETQAFNDPNPAGGQQGTDQCQQNQVEQLADYHCQFPYTKAELHLMSIPDPNGAMFTARWAGSGSYEDFPAFSDNGTPESPMWVSMYDNEAACDGTIDTAECDNTQKFQEIEVKLGEILLGTVDFTGGFGLNDSLGGVSFSLAYTGKDGTLTLNAGGDLAYDLVLYVANEDGTTSALDTISVTPGDNEFTATNSLDQYAEAHIHVSGTKINLAKATF